MGFTNMSMVFARFLAKINWIVGSFIKHKPQDGTAPKANDIPE